MDLFQNLKDNDQFTGDFLDKNLMQFVFMNLVQVSKSTDNYHATVGHRHLYK